MGWCSLVLVWVPLMLSLKKNVTTGTYILYLVYRSLITGIITGEKNLASLPISLIQKISGELSTPLKTFRPAKQKKKFSDEQNDFRSWLKANVYSNYFCPFLDLGKQSIRPIIVIKQYHVLLPQVARYEPIQNNKSLFVTS